VDPLANLGAVDARDRAIAAATLGVRAHRWPRGTSDALAALAARDPDPAVRAAALGALVRKGGARSTATAWLACAVDPDTAVRRRAAELGALDRSGASTDALLRLLDDSEPLVAEAAAFSLGERAGEAAHVVEALSTAALSHRDPLVREAAVAALGSLGDRSGLAAILAACDDKPAIRRRAVLALAAFEGAEVDAALQRALTDADWQVRQAAEDLTGQ
jgi:HEAT repeat protein